MSPISRFPVLRFWRWGLAALAGLLLILVAGRWSQDQELNLREASLRQASDAYVLALRGIVEKYGDLPYVVARHPDVLTLLRDPADRGQVTRVDRYLADLQRQTGAEVLYVVDSQGLTLAAGNWDQPTTFVGHSYRLRPYFQDALGGRRGLFYGVGLTTGQPGLFIAEPVRNAGAIVGVVVVKLGLERVEQAWSRATDPVLLQDRHGIVFLSSVPDWLYRADRDLAPADLEWLHQHAQYGARDRFERLPWQFEQDADLPGLLIRTRLDGRPRELLALRTHLPELGWTLTVTGNLDEVWRSRLKAEIIAALVATVLLLGLVSWRQREKRYAEQRQARVELERRVEDRTRDLEEAHAFRKSMEDSLLVGMRAHDSQGRVIYVNRALCEMVGFPQDELLGCVPPYPYWHPDDVAQLLHEHEATRNGGVPHGFETRFRHRDGHEVICMVYAAPLIDARGLYRGWMSSIVDITAQKQAEARQREQERQLQHSARLASVGEMASTIAHDLNQPLMALSNFALAARAMADPDLSPMIATALDGIVEQATRASDIVRRVRAFINPQRAVYETLAINELVEHAHALLLPELQRSRVVVVSDLAAGLPSVRGDRVLLEQVLVNLIQNAVQAMRETPPSRRRIELSSHREGGVVEIRVADQGPGIPADRMEQIFLPFFSTRPDGLGLGLKICRTIIEAHSGRLWVANRLAGGAAFTFTLPINP
ncbi:ATP-binding protein [Castellaniella sp. MT123]|uniref:sensor histidine kinase n=1 Tax=Castellaniella sp. MT123 TaxID=3140381 RepID=UPI0031F3A9A1